MNATKTKTVLALSLGLMLPLGTALADDAVDDITMQVMEHEHPETIMRQIQMPQHHREQEQSREHEQSRQHQYDDMQATHEQLQEMHEQRHETQERVREHAHDSMGGPHGHMK